MTRQLAYTVHVPDEDGAVQHFGPGDEVPGWAAKAITNPGAWEKSEDDKAEDKPADKPAAHAAPARRR